MDGRELAALRYCIGHLLEMQLRPDGLKLGLIQRRDRSGIIRHFTYDDEQRVKEIRFERNSEFPRLNTATTRSPGVTRRWTRLG